MLTGSPTTLIAAVGDDPRVHQQLQDLSDNGVDVTHIRARTATGSAIVLVEPGGETSMSSNPVPTPS